MNKKIIALTLGVFFFSATSVLAQGNGDQLRIQDPEVHMEDEDFEPGDMGDQDQDMFQNMENMMEQFKNPEVGEQIREMSQNQAQVQQEVQVQLSEMTKRSGIAKFLFGPDYKNAAKLRENIQKLRDDADTLSEFGEESVTMATADALNQEADALEEELNNHLSGFSLFGWLSKLIAKY